MEIKKAIDFSENIQDKISELFVNAYWKDLKFFSKDKVKLSKALSHMFVLDNIYVALIDNEIAGMAVCIDKEHFCINHKKKVLIEYLGKIKGTYANKTFTNYFNKYPKYPMEIDSETASIEFVATNTKYRKKGVATTIMKYFLTLPEYKHFVLEVADTNTNAFELYEKLGFREVYRKKMGFIARKISGVNNLVYMKYSK